jgi:hypothetical protein
MAQVASGQSVGADARPVSGTAVGFTIFAAVMMMMIGGFHVIAGLTALFENEFFVVSPNYVFEFDVTTWGWIHLIGGMIVVAAGFGLLNGQVWARSIGVIIAVVSALANFLWLPYYPVWSALIIVVDVLVIWALTVHGRDITTAS